MPLIDDETIDSLRGTDGRWPHFSLFLLGAVPISHRGISPAAPVPPEDEWRPRVICTRITQARLHTIRHQAQLMRPSRPKAKPPPVERSTAWKLRRLRQRLEVKFNGIRRLFNEALK